MIDPIANLRTLRYGNQSSELAQIQSARNALRILDTEITKTEIRLRALPAMVPQSVGGSGGGSGGGLSQEQRLIDRRLPRKMRGNKIGIGPVELGGRGVGLNAGYMRGLGGKAMTGMIGFHVTAGLINQGMNVVDRQRSLQAEGAGATERSAQFGLDVIGGAASAFGNLTGTAPLARSLLRAGGMTQEDADRLVSDAFDRVFTTTEGRNRKQRKITDAMMRAAAEVTKQYQDDNEFLDSWTPEDFDVADDAGRSQLRAEMVKRNRKYLNALGDLRLYVGTRSAAMNARGS